MPEFIKANGAINAADTIFSSDGGQWGLYQPILVLGLKDLVVCEIQVTGAEREMHSGMHGGGITNPIHALSLIITSMQNQDGKITIDGFYEDVIDLTVQVRNEIAKVSFDEDDYCKSVGAPESFGEMGYTIPESLSARPTLELNSICGGYQVKGTKTVLPSEASAKITCRLVADRKPERIYELLKSHVEPNTPRGVTVKVKQLPVRPIHSQFQWDINRAN